MKPIGHYDIKRAIILQKQGSGAPGLARTLGCTERELDLILYAKLGRSIPETVDIVNSPGWQARAA